MSKQYSNGYFIESASVPVVVPSEQRETIADEKARKARVQLIIDADMRRRSIRAKKIQYTQSALQAITYLLGDSYRCHTSPQQRREDESVKSMSASQFATYLDNAKSKLVKQILGDRETVEAMQRFPIG